MEVTIMKKRIKRRILTALLSTAVIAGTVNIPFLPSQADQTTAQAAESAAPTLTVRMDEGTRPLKHGASGWLYGLADEEVPTSSLITPLKPNTAVQKAPYGMQHPDGDVLDTAKTFLKAGGKNLQIYVPDYYALWGYEFTGTDQYLKILRMEAQACIDAGIAEDVSYVLYNEPSSNWIGTYHDGDGNQVKGWNAMFWFWLDMVEELRHYRNLEKELGLEEHEIVINEYADFTDCSAPGKLACWIGLWEEYNVSGCLPFWHLSNNLNGLAADANEGNGAWWLYKWYGDMSGNYLPVTVEGAEKSRFYGAASLDENKNCANIVFGGQDGEGTIVLSGVTETDTFRGAESIHISVEETDYTGFHGVAEEPHVLLAGTLPVIDGTVTIPIENLKELSAYRVTLTKAAESEAAGLSAGTCRNRYEAEDGELGGRASIRKVNSSVPCSAQKIVSGVKTADDSVTVTVDVPENGYYKFDMVYAAGDGVNTQAPARNYPYPAEMTLSVDGEHVEDLVLPNTLGNSMAGMYSSYVPLEKGIHRIQLSGTAASRSSGNIDCLYLTYAGAEQDSTEFHHTYEAELADFNMLSGRTDTLLATAHDGAVSYVEHLHKRDVPSGGGLRFTAVVPEDGMYKLDLSYRAAARTKARIYVGNDAVNLDHLGCELALPASNGQWADASRTVFLQKGVNIIDVDAVGEIGLDSMTISAARSGEKEPVAQIEAEDCTLSGEAGLGTNETTAQYASGGSYVEGIKAANGAELISSEDADFTVTGLARFVDLGEAPDQNNMQIHVSVPESGEYKLVVYQSNGELFGKHSYNFQMVERYAIFQVNDGEKKKAVFRNTYSDAVFKPQVVTLTLNKGENTIKIYNDNSKIQTNGVLKSGKTEHIPENIDYHVLTNHTPNFDRFVLYPALIGSVLDDGPGETPADPAQNGANACGTQPPSAGNGPKETSKPNESDPVSDELPKKGKKYTVKGYQYKILKSSAKTRTVSVVKSVRKNRKQIVIPQNITIRGKSYVVTKIEAGAFRNMKTARQVDIRAKQIRTIGKQAFTGIWKRAKIKVPASKYGVYRKLLKNRVGKGMKVVKK